MNSPSDFEDTLKSTASGIVRDVTCSSVVSISQILKGVMTYKFNIEVSGGEHYIVRFYPQSRDHIVRFEPDVVRRFAKLGIPVPEVVADSRSGPDAELEYMVYKMITGVTLGERISSLSKPELDILTKQLVDVLLALKSCDVSGYGDLIDAHQAKYHSWDDFVQHSFKEGLCAIKRGDLLGEGVTAQLEKLYGNIENFSPIAMGGIAWGDIALSNIVVDQSNRLAALIDFEGVLAAEPLLNIGYCFAAYRGTAFFDSLLQSWPDGNSKENKKMIEFYAALRAIRILRYVDKSLPCGAARTPIDKLLPGFLPALSNLNE